MGRKLYTFLEKYPKHYDVTFFVGSEKTVVQALSIILRSSSPVFEREFEDRWDQAVMKQGEGIPLPDFDPVSFKLFIKLMILDSFSVDDLKPLKLPLSQLLHLMSICGIYEMTTAVLSLTELVKELLRNFNSYAQTDDFLQLSEQQLELILTSDEIPMGELDVCRYAFKWADEQCRKKKLESTASSHRLVLGNCLYQIRFPLLSLSEFTTVIRIREGLLSTDETIEIFQLIRTEGNERTPVDPREPKFIKRRRSKPINFLSVIGAYPVIDIPFVCDGSMNKHYFNINKQITHHGVGFLGPMGADSFFNVTVQIWKKRSFQDAVYSVKMKKRIFAEKLKTFYFIFDQPVVVEPIPFDTWENCYRFHFSLEGPNTRCLQTADSKIVINHDIIAFTVYWDKPQLVELLYNA